MAHRGELPGVTKSELVTRLRSINEVPQPLKVRPASNGSETTEERTTHTMTMTDPIADMLTRLRNANQAYHDSVTMPYSKLKQGVAEILKVEGYITSFDVAEAPTVAWPRP